MFYLKFVKGAYEGKIFPIKSEEISIGRSSDNVLILPPSDQSISRNHTLIENKFNQLYLTDLNSKNGTYLNGRRILPKKKILMKPGDSIKIGSSIFLIEEKKNSDNVSDSIKKIDNFLRTQLIDPIKTTLLKGTINSKDSEKIPTSEIQSINTNSRERGSQLKILEQIASGGMSRIYKALFLDTGEIVAIKLPKQEFKGKKDILSLFKKEIKMSLKFKHPNIIETLMEVTYDEMSTMVMEFFPSNTLAYFISQNKSLNDEKLIINQIFSAFSYIHGKGIIHNDIKPGNILINNKSVIKISDFGTAGTPAEIRKMRREWKLFGTLLYVAPEQLIGDTIDIRSDIYSLGVVLYEYFTHINPFKLNSTNVDEVREKKLNFAVPPLYEYNSQINPELSNSILKAIERDPEKRYKDLMEFKSALVQYLY
jgi:pSer/pThr/pTyr-binding forkhead associated (FHA) protein/tRNA A-37 threonylcarbamoyl transferase component Bud32